MGEGWQLLKIRGIPLRIHPSWFVILGLATVAFQQQYSQQLSGSGSSLELWGLGLLTAVTLHGLWLLGRYEARRFRQRRQARQMQENA